MAVDRTAILPGFVGAGRGLLAARPYEAASDAWLDFDDHRLIAARAGAKPAAGNMRCRRLSRSRDGIWRYALMVLLTVSFVPSALAQADTTSPSATPPASSPFGVPSATPPASSPFGLPSATPPASSPYGLPSTTPPATAPVWPPWGTPSLSSRSGLPSASPSSLPASVLPSAAPSLLPGIGLPAETPSAFPSAELRSDSNLFGSTVVPPPFPSSRFGFAGAPATYRGATPPPTQLPPLSTNILLPPIASGATPVQAAEVRAPAFLIQPTVGIVEELRDNALNAHTGAKAALVTRPAAGLSISADTVHLQALMNTSLDYEKFTPTVVPDRLNVNMTAYGLGTVVPEVFFVDGRAAISQLSTSGGVGFSNPALIPRSQQTQVFTTSVTPILRERFGELVEADLRANLGLVNSGNSVLIGNSGGPAPTTSLGNVQQERSTLTVAVGRGYGVAGARFTLDAANIESQSVAQSTQIRSFGDVQYRFTPVFAAVGRVGFEDLRYPRGRLAFNEPIFQIGGQMTTAIGGAVLRFGRQDGFYGFDGALRFQITPALAVLASHQHSLGSSTESVLTNLNNSSLDPYGTMVDSTTALPLGLANPEFAATTDLFRNQQSRVALELDAGRTDSFRLFAFLDHRVSLAGLSSSDTAKGASFSWFRSLTPDLTSTVALGYATRVAGGGTKTATVDLALNYTMTDTLSGAVHYELTDSESHISASSFLTNVFVISLRKSF